MADEKNIIRGHHVMHHGAAWGILGVVFFMALTIISISVATNIAITNAESMRRATPPPAQAEYPKEYFPEYPTAAEACAQWPRLTQTYNIDKKFETVDAKTGLIKKCTDASAGVKLAKLLIVYEKISADGTFAAKFGKYNNGASMIAQFRSSFDVIKKNGKQCNSKIIGGVYMGSDGKRELDVCKLFLSANKGTDMADDILNTTFAMPFHEGQHILRNDFYFTKANCAPKDGRFKKEAACKTDITTLPSGHVTCLEGRRKGGVGCDEKASAVPFDKSDKAASSYNDELWFNVTLHESFGFKDEDVKRALELRIADQLPNYFNSVPSTDLQFYLNALQ